MGRPCIDDFDLCVFDCLERRGWDRGQYHHISASRCPTVIEDPYGDLGAFQHRISSKSHLRPSYAL